jgi:hypothetical protein
LHDGLEATAARKVGRERSTHMPNDSNWDVEFAGIGSVLGEGLVHAEYFWRDDLGWEIRYTNGGSTIATSAAPRHPSLGFLGPDDAGEKRVIEVAFAVIDQIEDGAAEYAERLLASR